MPSVLQSERMNQRRIELQGDPNENGETSFKIAHPWLWLALRRVAPELDLASQLHGLRVRRHLELFAQVWKEKEKIVSLVKAIVILEVNITRNYQLSDIRWNLIPERIQGDHSACSKPPIDID